MSTKICFWLISVGETPAHVKCEFGAAASEEAQFFMTLLLVSQFSRRRLCARLMSDRVYEETAPPSRMWILRNSCAVNVILLSQLSQI